jgi:hypothetical protein
MAKNTRRGLLAGLLGGIGSVVLTAAPAQAQTGVEVYGIIRFPSTGPEVLDDANHTPKGVTGVSITSAGLLEIQHDDLINVGHSQVTVDETLVARTIMVGQSQGFTSATVRFYDSYNTRVLNLSTAADYARISHANANIWFRAQSYSA